MTKERFDISNRLLVLLSILIVLIAVFVVSISVELFGMSYDMYPPEITVEGTGVVYVQPDTLDITLNLDVEADTEEVAINENKEMLNKILSALNEIGISENDISTDYYYIGPNYQWTELQGDFTDGVLLTHTIIVNTKQIDLADEIVELASKAGVNGVEGVFFTLEDTSTAENQARVEAIKIAKEKAVLIAKESGLDLDDVIGYYEYNDGDYYDDYYGKGAFMQEPIYDYTNEIKVEQDLSDYLEGVDLELNDAIIIENEIDSAIELSEVVLPDENDSTIKYGKQKISLTVSLTYEID